MEMIDAVVPLSFEVVWAPRIADRVHSHRPADRYRLPSSATTTVDSRAGGPAAASPNNLYGLQNWTRAIVLTRRNYQQRNRAYVRCANTGAIGQEEPTALAV